MNGITNKTIFEIDWSAAERKKFLNAIPKEKGINKKQSMQKHEPIMTQDFAAGDARSVKASLDGRGDYRVWWWNVNVLVHRMINPTADMEAIMLAFHLRHYKLTCLILDAKEEIAALHKNMRLHGILFGVLHFYRAKKL